ncbi:mevalonate kinase [Pneumocystis jirovecii RU7]|uniref:Mevalonate kinase n=1 Tax=Pneumocystis jirovecii (strain RU7) TaxID=1408657 RepID=A0A0W4ZNG1_PNEJ7|nr:mevalonate kinase [Pneumocystis jirovecii RU7]KTW29918.1 mevalonate kinase [Pneumocystis jirovecii RU7]
MKALFVSSPGKIILFGEHAVVYGKAAIAASVSLRTYLMIFSHESEESIVCIKFPDINLEKSWKQDDFPWNEFSLQDPLSPPLELNKAHISRLMYFVKDQSSFCSKAILAFLYMYMNLSKYNKSKSFTFILRSAIPIGSGLGSSASLSVCLATGLLLFNGHINPPNGTLSDKKALFIINSWAFNGEMCIHENPSGIDNIVSSEGNVVFFRKINTKPSFISEILHGFPTLPLLLVNTLQTRSTSDLVNNVKSLYQNYKDIVSCIFNSIDHISMNFKLLYEESQKYGNCHLDHQQIGTLMRINHNLLCALGVGHEKFEKIVKIVNDYDIGWTKLTGAGGGGCVVILLREGLNDYDIHKFQLELVSNGFDVYKVTLGDKGVGMFNCDDDLYRKFIEVKNRKEFMDFLELEETKHWKYWT